MSRDSNNKITYCQGNVKDKNLDPESVQDDA